MSDYRGGPLDSLTQIFLEVLRRAAESDKSVNPDAYISKWNEKIKYLNEILTTAK